MDDLGEAAIMLAVVLTGLLVLYTVVRLAVRDGVLDARAKDDAQLARRPLDGAARPGRRTVDADARLDDLLDSEGPT